MIRGFIAVLALALAGCASGVSEEEVDALNALLASEQARVVELEGALATAEAAAAAAESQAETALETARREAEAELNEREADLEERASELDEREAAITQAEEVAAKSEFGNGVWEVGVDIVPGRYKTSGGSRCYWAKLTNDADQKIIDNQIADGPQTVTIQDRILFESKDCGTWVRQQ